MAGTLGVHSPFLCSITVTNTAQTLLALMRAVYPDFKNHLQYLSIQVDPLAGATVVYLGNLGVLSTNCGINLQAGQAPMLLAGDSNLIIPGDIYLLASAATVQVNVVAMTR